MTDSVIRVQNLCKRYRLGVTHSVSLRELVNRGVGKLFRWQSDDLERPLQQNAQKTSGIFEALSNVTFEVERGEIVGVIGRNGAGKSTLLKILSGIASPTSGRGEMYGRVASLLEVGTGFHPELTGRENVYLNGAILGMSKSEVRRKFDAIVDFAEIHRFIDTPAKRYSSGMYVRLAFAVAAHLDPEILIVDEVLAVGDTEFQSKCIGRMRDVAASGRTVLFVSHNLYAVQQLTTRCLLLEQGRLTVDAPTPVALLAYRNRGLEQPHQPHYENLHQEEGLRRVAIRTSHDDHHDFGEELQVDFEFMISRPMPQACFSFQIVDDSDRSASHYWLLERQQPLRNAVGRIAIRCTIPNPRLYMGQYTLRTHLSDSRSRSIIESLDGICPFQVTMESRHRPEYQWSSGAAAYLDDFEWRWRDLDSPQPDVATDWRPSLRTE